MFTIQEFNKLKKIINNNIVKPGVIQTEAEALDATKRDLNGKTWKVGDEYYTQYPQGLDNP